MGGPVGPLPYPDRKRTISVFENGKIEDLLWKLQVSCQVMTYPCFGVVFTFCRFISHLIGHKPLTFQK